MQDHAGVSKLQGFKVLCQGDLLAPFLFVLVADVLSSMLDRGVMEGCLEGFTVGLDGTHINHHKFADDTVIFSQDDNNLL